MPKFLTQKSSKKRPQNQIAISPIWPEISSKTTLQKIRPKKVNLASEIRPSKFHLFDAQIFDQKIFEKKTSKHYSDSAELDRDLLNFDPSKISTRKSQLAKRALRTKLVRESGFATLTGSRTGLCDLNWFAKRALRTKLVREPGFAT